MPDPCHRRRPGRRLRGILLTSALLATGCGGAPGPGEAPAPDRLPSGSGPASEEGLQAAPAGACPRLGHLSRADRALADTLLAQGLDNEALFTLVGALKPMSSLSDLRLEIFDAGVPGDGEARAVRGEHAHLARAARITRVAEALDCGPLDFVVVPFRATPDTVRTVAVSVLHRGLLDELLRREADFFGQWGLLPEADAGTVVTVVEFESRLDRFRGYGYLFGYPEYAVDFFVEAAGEAERTGDFVPRDFVQIPVHSAERGRFVYAVPEGHAPGDVDHRLREEAAAVLAEYRRRRPAYVNPDGTLRAAELLRDWGWAHPAGFP